MLSVLAQRFDCTVDQLRSWNSLTGDTIQIGQELVVAEESADEQREAATYRVRQGDTLGRIAQRHGVSVDEIVATAVAPCVSPSLFHARRPRVSSRACTVRHARAAPRRRGAPVRGRRRGCRNRGGDAAKD